MNWKHGTIFLLYRHTFSENELTDFIVKWHQQFYTPIEGTHFYIDQAPDFSLLFFRFCAHAHHSLRTLHIYRYGL